MLLFKMCWECLKFSIFIFSTAKYLTKVALEDFDKSNPITDLDRPIGFQEVEAPRFQDSWHM
jgi:hypothetical protein